MNTSIASPTLASTFWQDQAAGPAARVPGQAGAPATGAPVGEGAALVPGDATAAQAAPPGSNMMLFIMMGVFAFMIISMMMNSRKQRKQTQQLLASLSRGDTVQTAAGIIGVIGEVRDDVVVLKIDESTHTKMKVTKASVVRVIKQAADKAGASDVVEAEAA